MQLHHIAGYKFISLHSLDALRQELLDHCKTLQLKGTVLLSLEGINISLAGSDAAITQFLAQLQADERFTDMTFHHTFAEKEPFQRLKIKLKKEIITLREPTINPVVTRAPTITANTLKTWLDEKRDITLFDTRNDYEIRFGTFNGAKHLELRDFSTLPTSIADIARDKPIVMFCTGGIRCEKAALLMLAEGYTNVYQLEGGILGYFANVGGEHFHGDCFVFDERVAVNAKLEPTCHPKLSEG